MSFLRDFFHNLFGGDGNNGHNNPRFDDYQPPSNGFRNPIWQNNEDNEDEYGDDYRRFANPHRDMPFQIFSNPFGIMKYFESQMNSMMEDMMSFGLRDGLTIEEFNDSSIPEMLPPPSHSESNLRDQFLKSNRALPAPNAQNNPKIDMDLDGKVTAEDVSKVWKNSVVDDNKQLMPRTHQESFHGPMNFGFSSGSQFSMEQRSTVTDGAGNTKTTIKRQVGDKLHTIITERNRDGVETRTESFTDVGESNFGLRPKIDMGTFGTILWDEFFSPDPKL